ncbi:hypothetical protein [Thioflexithrix psekupsensis]|uniref:TIGR02646 family protein n=1 Tax=Thioflexithrix psekupsensis TaxID=1570016 RepID=A0A251X4S5_9GAMM|nr:hypothetical protein [Thioflexithrix psekupsensis]OUD12355.1 hypothetical protein TPSD3_14685 [Thioflexithrix psekupsensis]
MRKIDKNREPICLTHYKKQNKTHNYAEFSGNNRDCFDELRLALLQESGFLCCYCMQRIVINEGNETDVKKNLSQMIVEHFKPKSVYDGTNGKKNLHLDYNNLIATCNGNQSSKGNEKKHCGALKDNGEFVYLPNPASDEFAHFQTKIKYKERGSEIKYLENPVDRKVLIVAPTNPDDIENDELVGTRLGKLNLNESNLAKKRYAVWNKVKRQLEQENWERSKIEEKIKEYSTLYEKTSMGTIYHVYHEFCAMVVFFLEGKLLTIKNEQ